MKLNINLRYGGPVSKRVIFNPKNSALADQNFFSNARETFFASLGALLHKIYRPRYVKLIQGTPQSVPKIHPHYGGP